MAPSPPAAPVTSAVWPESENNEFMGILLCRNYIERSLEIQRE